MKDVMGKVAMIGAGYWGRNLLRNYHALGALGIVCDSDEARLSDAAAQYPGCRITASIDDVLADTRIPAVAIATPAETHSRLVREALEAGKDVFVEKPLCLSVRDGKQIVKFAAANRRILMVGHLLWYHPAILKLKEIVESGDLGSIRYIYSSRLNLGKIRREENILWSFAPHDVSVILGLIDEMPDMVQSQGGNYLHGNIADVTVSLLSFPSGIKAHIFVSWLHPFKEQKLVVVGSDKMAVFDDMEPDNKLVVYAHKIDLSAPVPVVSKAGAQPIRFEIEEPLKAECRHFLECVRTRRKPRTDGEEGLRVLQVLEQCQADLG